MHTLLSRTAAIGFVLSQPGAALAQFTYDDIVKATFQSAIVKVEVSVTTPLIKEGKNLCDSQGTGFLVAPNHVVTAAHVFEIPNECGTPKVVVRSRKFDLLILAKIVRAKDDIALLQTESTFPSNMCSLGVRREDAFNTDGYRLGIPGQMQDPSPIGIRIGPADSEFDPLIHLTGEPAEPGESGGPVLVGFNVVGVLKARHLQYVGHSFMMTASKLRNLMAEVGVVQSGKICNPVQYYMSADGRSILLQPSSDLNATERAAVLKQIEATSLHKATTDRINVQRLDREISVTVPDTQIVLQKSCFRILGREFACTTVPRPVPNFQASATVARQITDEISKEILSHSVGKIQLPAPPRI